MSLTKAALVAMAISGAIGAACWSEMTFGTIHPRLDAFSEALNITALMFWIVFPFVYGFLVRRSPAVLDFDGRVRLAEELFKRK